MILTGTTISPTNESDWLKERMYSVGASEAAAALGVCPYTSPVELWMRKLGLGPAVEENEAMRWGKVLEPVLATEYERRTGRLVGLRQQFMRHPTRPYITATIDGMTDDRLVEFKTCGRWNPEWGDEDTDSIPEPYLIQVAQQMSVTGAVIADVAVLIGGQRFRIYTIERDPNLITLIERGVERFWNCVLNHEPPTWGRMEAAELAIINPKCHGDIDLSPEYLADVFTIEETSAQIKTLEAETKAAKLRLLAALGTNRTGRLADGRIVRRYRDHVVERTHVVKAHTKHYTRILKGESR